MSDAKDKKGDPKSDEEAAGLKKSGGGNKVLVLLVGVNSLLLVGVMGFMAYTMTRAPHPAAEAAAKPAEEKRAEAKEEKGEKAEGKEEKGGEGKEEGGGRAAETAGKGGPMVKIADFVVHLRNPDADRYARVSFEVEVFADSDKDRLNASTARVRDAFIGYLSDRTLEDLRGSEGLSRTKEALQTTLRQLLPDVRIRALYISDFVVQ